MEARANDVPESEHPQGDEKGKDKGNGKGNGKDRFKGKGKGKGKGRPGAGFVVKAAHMAIDWENSDMDACDLHVQSWHEDDPHGIFSQAYFEAKRERGDD